METTRFPVKGAGCESCKLFKFQAALLQLNEFPKASTARAINQDQRPSIPFMEDVQNGSLCLACTAAFPTSCIEQAWT